MQFVETKTFCYIKNVVFFHLNFLMKTTKISFLDKKNRIEKFSEIGSSFITFTLVLINWQIRSKNIHFVEFTKKANQCTQFPKISFSHFKLESSHLNSCFIGALGHFVKFILFEHFTNNYFPISNREYFRWEENKFGTHDHWCICVDVNSSLLV